MSKIPVFEGNRPNFYPHIIFQIPADRTAEPDENLLDDDLLPNLAKRFLDTSTGTEANVDKHATGTEDQIEKGDRGEIKDQEIINDEESKKGSLLTNIFGTRPS